MQPRTARGIENDDSKWVYNKPEKTMTRNCNVAEACTAIRLVQYWKPEGKRPSSHPRKRRIDVVEKYLEDSRVRNWKEIVEDRERWNRFGDDGKNSWRVIEAGKRRTGRPLFTCSIIYCTTYTIQDKN